MDITPHTYSTSALRRTGFSGEMMCVPIIPRNTPLPAGKSEIFFTVMDEQEKAEVTVFQGESDKPEENNFIGNFLVENLAKVPAGNQLIHYDPDVYGLLKVTATEKNTGVAKTAVLDTRCAHALDVSEARRNIASLIGNATGGEPVDTGTDGDAGAEALAGSEPRRCGRITAAGWWRKNARSSIKANPQAKRSWRPEADGNRGVRRGDKPPGGGVPIDRSSGKHRGRWWVSKKERERCEKPQYILLYYRIMLCVTVQRQLSFAFAKHLGEPIAESQPTMRIRRILAHYI